MQGSWLLLPYVQVREHGRQANSAHHVTCNALPLAALPSVAPGQAWQRQQHNNRQPHQTKHTAMPRNQQQVADAARTSCERRGSMAA
jgi:hypothetical protein